MSRRYWCLILAAVGCLIASASEAQNNDKAGQRAESAAADQRQAERPPPPSNLAANQAETYQPTCEAPKSREDASFCQEVAANRIAGRNFWLTIVGTIAVVLSLVFTGWAAVAAGRAAKAAESSVEDARKDAAEQVTRFNDQLKVARTGANAARALAVTSDKTAKRQLRAYLNVRGASFGLDDDGKPIFTILIINHGQTPAKDVLIYAKAGVYPWLADPSDRPHLDEPLQFPVSVQPKDASNFPVRTSKALNAFERKVAISGEVARLLVYGRVEYEDVFGERHVTPIALSVSGGKVIKKIFDGEPLDPEELPRFEAFPHGDALT